GRASRNSAKVRRAVVREPGELFFRAGQHASPNLVCRRGVNEPVSRWRCANRCTHARLTLNVSATSTGLPLTDPCQTKRTCTSRVRDEPCRVDDPPRVDRCRERLGGSPKYYYREAAWSLG